MPMAADSGATVARLQGNRRSIRLGEFVSKKMQPLRNARGHFYNREQLRRLLRVQGSL